MSNDQVKKIIDEGMVLCNPSGSSLTNYKLALNKFETALSHVEPWDTQLREKIQIMIEKVKSLIKIRTEKDYYNSQWEMLERAKHQFKRRG
jgi:hypothetical protein